MNIKNKKSASKFHFKKGDLISFHWIVFEDDNLTNSEIRGLCTKIKKKGLTSSFSVRYNINKR